MKTHILIVGGFLGSGKTSVLLKLMQYISSSGKTDSPKIAIIENEIGEISVDDKVMGGSYAVRTIAGGCVCCTLTTSLLDGIKKLQEEIDPDYIVLETTGLASPNSVKRDIEKFLKTECVRICCVVDSGRWNKLSKSSVSRLLQDQLAGADVILINKIDLTSDEILQEVRQSVASYNQNARIIPITSDEIDDEVFDLILG